MMIKLRVRVQYEYQKFTALCFLIPVFFRHGLMGSLQVYLINVMLNNKQWNAKNICIAEFSFP